MSKPTEEEIQAIAEKLGMEWCLSIPGRCLRLGLQAMKEDPTMTKEEKIVATRLIEEMSSGLSEELTRQKKT